MEFSRQEYWSGLLFPSPGDLPDPGIEPESLALWADALPSESPDFSGRSPWGRKESDTTERLHLHFSLSGIGEGNGNPLQYSCLENPMDGGAWRATVHGVRNSQTRLNDFTFTFGRTEHRCRG